ncbi:MAG: hypothetical protein PVJ67_06195 [Candidatus Pacearchaeota archaeon]|jgi:hypothetical protein
MAKKLNLIASALLFAGLTCCSAQNQYTKSTPKIQPPETPTLESKVGDPMPKAKTDKIASKIIERFLMVGYGPVKDNIPQITEIYQYCRESPEKYPFVYYNNKTKILYLDILKEDGSPSSDGKTDFIIPNAKKIILFQFAPPCPQEL